MGANKKVEDLSDIARHGFELGVRCWCGHKATLSIGDTVRYFHCRQWPTSTFQCRRHFRCSKCGRKGQVRVGVSAGLVTDHGVYPRREEDWKRLVRRLRG